MATDLTSPPARTRPGVGAFGLLAGLAIGVLVLDQVAKWLVVANLQEGVSNPVIGELVQFRFVRNPGAAFSFGIGATWIFAVIAIAVVVLIVVFARRIRSLAWASVFGLLLGGTVGNLIDRLVREPGFGQGHVIDFIQLWGFPAIFNIADIAITASVVLLIVLTIMGIGIDGSRGRRRKDTVADEEAARGDA